MRTVVKIALGIVLAGIVLIGGCAVVFGVFVSEVDKGVREEGQKNAISRADAAKVKRGMSEDEVVGILGKPRDTQDSEDDLGKTRYLYYNVKGGGGALNQWQFVFENGKLRAKNRD